VPRALVTGGAGFVGGHLAAALTSAGWEVRTLDVHPAPGDHVVADVRDAEAVERAAAGCSLVVDNAALVPVSRASAADYRAVNVEGCRATLAAARRHGAYALHISSSAIFGLPARLPVAHDDPPAPFEPYGASKAEAEAVVAAARRDGLRVASLRPRTLLGAGRLGLFDVIFARVRAGRRVPMFGRGENRVQMCDVEDFCAAALAAVEREATGDYNVGAASFGTVREDLEALIAHAGTDARLLPVPVWAIHAALRPLAAVGRSPFTEWHWRSAPASFVFALEHTMEELDWRPRHSNAAALARAYDAYLAGPAGGAESVHLRPLRGGLARALRGGGGG